MLQRSTLFVLAVLFLLANRSVGQQVVRIGDASPVRTCEATFLDNGGVLQNHVPAGQQRTLTICSDGSTAGLTHVQLSFTVIDLRGTLELFNGDTPGADLLRVIDDTNNGDRITVSATAANASGCITAVFTSAGDKPGWEAEISCVAACQPILAELTASDPARNAANRDYIDVCVGDPVTLTGGARYPENNSLYPQSDATSTFGWTFGDGSSQTGRTVTHTYSEPGGYIVGLDVTDTKGCSNANNIGQRIRVAAPPVITQPTNGPIEVCPGESVSVGINGAGGSDYSVAVAPQTINFRPPAPTSERVAIPAIGSEQLVSKLSINNFGAGQKLRSGAGIEEICLSIEHTYVGDLSIWVECPDGRRIDLVRYDPKAGGATRHRFGNPPFPDTPEPGEPATYCWQAGAPRTLAEVAQANPPTATGPPALLPPDIKYQPLGGNFAAFAGCNLNGDWTLNIVDNEGGDDGTLYEWSIVFADQIDGGSESFIIPVGEVSFVDAPIFSAYRPDRVVYTANKPGFINQRIATTDSLGCDFEEVVPITIRSPFASECYTCPPNPDRQLLDTTICDGEALVPDIIPTLPDARRTVMWEAYTDAGLSTLPGSSDATYRSVLTVTDHLPTTIVTAGETVESVCVDLEGALTGADLELTLVSPDGARVPLLERGTVLAGNELKQCFSPAPASNTAWTQLAGTQTNGDWALEISGGDGPIEAHLISWSLNLVREAGITYRWSPVSPDFSCTDCPSPTITPTANGTYTLTATTADGCTNASDLRIRLSELVVDLEATIVNGCVGQNDGRITLPELADNISFAWSTGATSRSIEDLAEGTYSVTLTEAEGCRQILTYDIDPAPLPAINLAPTDLSCGGADDGRITTSISAGAAPYTFQWRGDTLPPTANLSGLSAGTYSLTVVDSLGCRDSASVTLTQPAPITLTPQTTPVSCRGGSDGTAAVLASGGSGPFRVVWRRDTTVSRLEGVPAGDYRVRVFDSNGCSEAATATVTEPDSSLSVLLTSLSGGCSGADDASVTALASGGNGGYTYRWSNGETTSVATRLGGGPQSVTVTDAKQCTVVGTITVRKPAPFELIAESLAATCGGQSSGRIDLRVNGGRGPYTFGLDPADLGTRPSVVGLATGTYVVYAEDARGCRARDTVEVADGLPLAVDLGPDLSIPFGDSIQIPGVITGAAGEVDLQWLATDLSTLSCLECTDPFVSPLTQATYSLSVVDALGCRAEDRITVRVLRVRAVDVATGFTPDGDGRNDRLFVQGRPGTRVLDFRVFDQWGGLLFADADFEVNDADRGWDGAGPTGKEAGAGVYVYKLTVAFEDGQRETRSGKTTLIR